MANGVESWNASAKTFSIRNAQYLVNFSEKDIPFEGPQNRSLVTVFKVPTGHNICITESWIKGTIQKYQRDDDVFQQEFLAGVILFGASESEVQVTIEARTYLDSVGMQWMQCLPSPIHSRKLLPGPSVLIDRHIRNVWRLFKDTYGTFMTTFLSGSFQEIPLNCIDDSFPSVAVPSRVRYEDEVCSPIEGWRVAVKDNYHISGIRTSLCNRAYRQTFPPPLQTADCIQKLVGLGAVILGKTKLNPFGVWVEPIEYVDYQAPWNPRADGYQSPGGSSAGSAAAVAAYEWLDIALGTDTAGSIMRPGLWCGCFALRPSFGAVSSGGLVKSIDYFDAPSLLSRDLQKCRDFASAWFGKEFQPAKPKPFSSIVWATDFWDVIDTRQCELAMSFVQDLESQLGLKHVKVSFTEEWSKAPPTEAANLSLREYMVPATTNIWYDFYHAFDEFREKHWEQYHAAPYLSPPVRKNWEAQKLITKSQRDDAVERLSMYRKWFKKQIIAGESEHPLFILPVENLSPRYRDEPPDFEKPLSGINSLFLSPVMEAPELIIPIGQIPYISKVSQTQEFLPFAIGLMSLHGSDIMLMDVIHQVLKKVGRPTSVHTGKMMFEGA